jgi:hypothetical protein
MIFAFIDMVSSLGFGCLASDALRVSLKESR